MQVAKHVVLAIQLLSQVGRGPRPHSPTSCSICIQSLPAAMVSSCVFVCVVVLALGFHSVRCAHLDVIFDVEIVVHYVSLWGPATVVPLHTLDVCITSSLDFHALPPGEQWDLPKLGGPSATSALGAFLVATAGYRNDEHGCIFYACYHNNDHNDRIFYAGALRCSRRNTPLQRVVYFPVATSSFSPSDVRFRHGAPRRT